MYAIPAWWGFLNVAEKDRIESVIIKGKRYGYLPSDFETAHSLVENIESGCSRKESSRSLSHLLMSFLYCHWKARSALHIRVNRTFFR